MIETKEDFFAQFVRTEKEVKADEKQAAQYEKDYMDSTPQSVFWNGLTNMP